MINHFHKLCTLVFTFALATTMVAFAQEGGKGDPDRAVTGGQFPAGWNARPDRGAPTGIKFSQTGDVYHFQMGTTGTMWRNDWTKSGNYAYSARLTQLKKASHPVSYGLVIGGSNMGPSPTYTYFLVRQQGEYFVSNWEGAAPRPVVDWTANPAITKEGADGKQSNTLSVQVQGDNVIFSVNGTEVTRLAKSKVHADGIIGFRVGHTLDVDVDQVKK
jgi:hypothetical protein